MTGLVKVANEYTTGQETERVDYHNIQDLAEGKEPNNGYRHHNRNKERKMKTIDPKSELIAAIGEPDFGEDDDDKKQK